tara:strand:- start:6045 stop:6215 length:171 start_codon:yes stop_codon:yes gene_type:complete
MNLETIQKEINNSDNKEVMDYLNKDVSQGWLVLCMMHMITNEQWHDLKKRIATKIN